MNSPILVWMLYLNREVTTEVRDKSFSRFFFSIILLNPSSLKEYEKCYELIHNTVPHAKNIPSNPSSGESLRSPFLRLGPSSHNFNLSCRPNHRPNDATPHDEAPSNTSCSMAGPQHTQREALDRAGTVREILTETKKKKTMPVHF